MFRTELLKGLQKVLLRVTPVGQSTIDRVTAFEGCLRKYEADRNLVVLVKPKDIDRDMLCLKLKMADQAPEQDVTAYLYAFQTHHRTTEPLIIDLFGSSSSVTGQNRLTSASGDHPKIYRWGMVRITS